MIDYYANYRPPTDEELVRRRVATHEAGHLIAAHLLGLPLDSATVVPTPDAAGLVRYALATDDQAAAELVSRNRIVAALAGRAALGDALGAGDDANTAWRCARGLVGDDVEFATAAGEIVADAWHEAKALVERNRPAINDVARALDLFGTLDHVLLIDTIERALQSQEFWAARDAARWKYNPIGEGDDDHGALATQQDDDHAAGGGDAAPTALLRARR